MERPSRRLLYILLAVLLVLFLLGFLVSGFIGLLIWIAMAAIGIYFGVVAYRDFERTRDS